MTATIELAPPPPLEVRQDIIGRFIDAAMRRSEYHIAPKRRSERRYHRSWPLSILLARDGGATEMTVALHNASGHGIAFLAERNIEVDCTVHIKLFWHDADCPHVPAVARHATPTPDGYLIGCEFVI